MLLSSVDFKKYKYKLEESLNQTFSSSDMFEEYVKQQLGSKNTRVFVVNIARAILLYNHDDLDLDIYTDKEIIILINVTHNKDMLLRYKEQKDLKPYLETIDNDKLELIENLEKVFYSSSIKKLEFNRQQIEDNSLEQLKNLYMQLDAKKKNEFRIWLVKTSTFNKDRK
jgi:hypothetical protein